MHLRLRRFAPRRMQYRKLISFVFSAVFSNLKGLGSHILPSQNFYPSLLTDNKINFNVVFPSSNLDTPLNLELGSGTGSWICNQAKKNHRENYVSVEMRTSRVSRTFSHSCLIGEELSRSESTRWECANFRSFYG